ncbi:class I SAM-dependent methyltransferase [Mechercharimyces sp. CAU 1602]|uniref:class I SAM-dependent methyltransferase n=1 Tax=Mechercharimyces sp. CAU 1602 TaxID=2973933 RepID=UPI002161BDEC|nr:class I SAM-dependent methyltransferase [Mechercharimyces sp. CAU 1602]MCS1350726.1 class I SAM-dependent methyltransferase [Mechercharimyces sp. CAU 1602]
MSEQRPEHWDSMYDSGEYLQRWDYTYPSQELVSFIATGLLPTDAMALDVGCGAGREAIFLAQQGFNVTGIDMSEKAIAIAKSRAVEQGVNVDFHCGNVLKMSEDNHSFDFVNDRGCFHLIGSEDRPYYVKEMVRVLKPGGRILLRGCREKPTWDNSFVPVTLNVIQEFFNPFFSSGPVLPLQMISNAAGVGLDGNLVVLQRRD